MIKPPRNSYGYRNLLVYNKAEELQLALADFVSHFPHSKTLLSLSDQMERSARSTKQNIVEGWKRNSTNEYYQFLGYAVASNAELEADFTDITKGIYGGKGLKGVEIRGIKGMKGDEMGELEKIPFYPLNTHLPPCLQLKLRAKELNFLLDKLQNSLLIKMKAEKTLSATERIRIQDQKEAVFRKEHEVYLKEKGWS
ncbi:MAG: four helix bundle protein [Candidatus Sungbacteria bacterium]|uniref:Four helix bundle protein n=1 Tax=Candidatus Sungiibacteriota bacterium TaxID=2750080 RepID=A0A931YD79_9BACT|nr:four helix bundle protein [Candidatus Sungbacteria bacterium]MBI2465714.1 four helix bundle protein [Candidatus Sungbacteria bacterium]